MSQPIVMALHVLTRCMCPSPPPFQPLPSSCSLPRHGPPSHEELSLHHAVPSQSFQRTTGSSLATWRQCSHQEQAAKLSWNVWSLCWGLSSNTPYPLRYTPQPEAIQCMVIGGDQFRPLSLFPVLIIHISSTHVGFWLSHTTREPARL